MTKKVSRFNLIRKLGKGAQGVVHLAIDPVLQRNVAIKTLHVENLSNGADTKQRLLREARTISKMVHPNIVSIYEAGEDEEHNPYLVFEYVSGQLLSDMMLSKGAMSVTAALSLLKPAIEAIAYANRQNIIHCDLKPSNILINDENTAKVMDFGIARILSEQNLTAQGFSGTPRYMPPEYLRRKTISAANDAYALGLILYEMLSGKAAFKANSIKQIISKVLHDSLPRPSKFNTDIDDKFESIILKAIDKKLENRYQSTVELNAAIDEYQAGQAGAVNQSRKKQDVTVEFLLRRMKRKKDFPALSESLFKINQIVDEEDKGFDELASAIVEDFALTSKILKIVNSAYYRRSAGEVKTISRAVMMLGFDAIRSIAVSLILIDHLHNKAQAKQLKDQVVSSLYSGVLAKNLAEKVQLGNKEEVFLSGVFHNLGKLLSIFYFNEESLEIARLVSQEKLTEENAALQVLGVSYNRLGIAIAKEWDLPYYIVNTIKPYNAAAHSMRSQLNKDEKLHAVSSLSNELTHLIEQKDNSDWRMQAVRLWREYTPQLKLKDSDLTALADQAKEDLVALNSILNINMSKSSIIEGLNRETDEEGTADIDNSRDKTAPSDGGELAIIIEPETKFTRNAVEQEQTPEEILTTGIDDINALLKDTYSVTDIFRLCMEVMQRALDFDHAVVCMANNQKKIMEAKFGYGISDRYLQQFQFPLNYQADVFHLALEKGADIHIADSSDVKILNTIPAWYQQLIDSESFIILPVMIKNKAIGLFYGDRFQANSLVIKKTEFRLLKKLKHLAAEALVKKYQK